MPDLFLPTFHTGQVAAWSARQRFYALRCGRRWGKTAMLETIACDAAAKGRNVGWFTPDYKIQSEAFNEIADYLHPIRKQSSKVEGVFRTTTGGRLDFWTLENERAGRSRKYHLVIVDEAAFTKPNMKDIWERAISPALWDYQGSAIVASTPNGKDPDNFFYLCCTQPEMGFVTLDERGNPRDDYCAPSWTNPHIPQRLLNETQEQWEGRQAAHWAKIQEQSHPLVYSQETKAEFVDWSGVAFFAQDKWLDDGKPLPYPAHCDAVYAVIDTALKDGQEHDGTGVIYFATNQTFGLPLLILDYDLEQILGNALEEWLPSVFRRLEELAAQCGARHGSLGVWIEDKASGIILLQQAAKHGWPAHPVDSTFTAAGKDARAISVSGYHYRGLVKISEWAFNKTVQFKGLVRNHLLTQVMGFRIGDKLAAKRADDLFDCYTGGVSIGLGDMEGI